MTTDRRRFRFGASRSGPKPKVPQRFPAGHYYSPLIDIGELRNESRRAQVWPDIPRETPGLDWRDGEQIALCREVFAKQGRLALELAATNDESAYFVDNGQYPPLDAWILEGLLRQGRPSQVIEIGSGFSSLVVAQVNREYLGGEVNFTCVEPYPRDFLRRSVSGITSLIEEKVQDVPLGLFGRLQDRDVLLIDTSHTVKTGGDVLWIFHEIVPRLAPGVLVHLHDIFLPHDYPLLWIEEGWGWNEQYLVQSFLQFNNSFDVVFGARWMLEHHTEELLHAFPGYPQHEPRGGSSLWIRRTGGTTLVPASTSRAEDSRPPDSGVVRRPLA